MLILLTAIVLLGCQSGSSTLPDNGETIVNGDNVSQILDKPWQLTGMIRDGNEIKLVDDSEVTILFNAEGKVAGGASVNRYFGDYELKETNLVWSGPGFGSTMMAGPEEMMTQEHLYLELLGKTNRISFSTAGMTLFADGNSVILKFEKMEE